MKDFLQKLWAQISEYFSKLEKAQKRRLLILAIVIVAVVIAVVVILNPPKQYAVLYTGLEASEAGEIKTQLEAMGVSVKTQGTETILVPAEQVSSVTMELAVQGYPKGSQFSTDYLQEGSGLGVTDEEKRTYNLLQLQDNLKRAIRSLSQVKDCAVIITPEQTSVFVSSDRNKPAKASVVLTLEEGAPALTNDQIIAIYHLITTSVQGLSEENISVVDSQTMTVYAPDDKTDPDDLTMTNERYQLKQQVKESYEASIEKLLAPVFGAGNISAQVDVTLDFDDTAVQSTQYAPPVPEAGNKGIEVSLKELDETIKNGAAASGEPGMDPNGGMPMYPTTEEDGEGVYSKTTREVNMEVNETNTQLVRAKGQVTSVTAAIIINTPEPDEDADPEETATQNAEVIARIKELVARTLGIVYEGDSERASRHVTVDMLDFQKVESDLTDIVEDYNTIWSNIERNEMTRLIIILVAVVIVVLLVFFMIRSLRPKPVVEYGVDDLGGYIDLSTEDGEDEDEEVGLEIDVTPHKTPAREQVEKLIDTNPDAVAQLLRNWLQEDFR